MLEINADYDSQDKLNQALRQNGVVFQTLLSDAEQMFGYSLICDFYAIACFAGPGFLVPVPGHSHPSRRGNARSTAFRWSAMP